MREIKYRAWDTLARKMISHDMIKQDFILYEELCDPLERNIFMQFTGMTDSEGKEIYEGDWVTIGGGVEFLEVVYQAPSFVMKKHLKKGMSKKWSTFIMGPGSNQLVNIIGNKYE